MIDLLILYLQVVLYSIGVLIGCGIFIAISRKLFLYFIGATFGNNLIMKTALIGTPIHEIGHAVMCLLFGHKIKEIKLFQRNKESGVLGYVTHAYNKRNLYQVLGNLFIALGPIISCILVISLILFIVFPNATNELYETNFAIINSNINPLDFITNSFKLLPNLVNDSNFPIYIKIIALVIISSICLHANLSEEDINGGLGGLLLYLLLTFIITLIVSLISTDLLIEVIRYLKDYSIYCFSISIILILFSVCMTTIAFLTWFISKLINIHKI
jgi:hypothetical protein